VRDLIDALGAFGPAAAATQEADIAQGRMRPKRR
jgi:hypothetical protein